MKKLCIVGSVDTRCLVYPIARALALNGLTAIVTEDGAYRRLYHGHSNIGTVSGVDVIVGSNLDKSVEDLADTTGVPYDQMILVSSHYIPEDVDGIIVCHGVDRSIIGKTDAEKEAEEEARIEREKAEAAARAKSKKKGAESEDPDAITPEKQAEMDRRKNEELDALELPDGVPGVEVHISYNPSVAKGMVAVVLKESAVAYCFNCEEKKELEVYPDKVYNKTLATLLNKAFGMEAGDAFNLLCRTETISGGKK